MTKLEILHEYAKQSRVPVFYQYIEKYPAATISNDFGSGIFLDRHKCSSESEELCVLAHEMGHIKTGATHRLYSPYELIEQHEYKANAWAIRQLMPKHEVMYAAATGILEIWDLAEYFSVTEDFAKIAYEYYMRDEYFFQFVMHLKYEDET